MVGWKHYHQNAHPHYLYLRRGGGRQDNQNREYDQEPDVHSLQGETEISQRQIHPGS